jgi:hypothetical protein
MEYTLERLRAATQLGIVMTATGAAIDALYRTSCSELVAQLENLREDAIKLHRDVLELPPQRSTALADVEQELDR